MIYISKFIKKIKPKGLKGEYCMEFYDLKVKNRKGEDVFLSDFKDKVSLIVNTATGCGFTPQYEGLEKLYKKYHKQGLEILDFPCDQLIDAEIAKLI